MKEEQKRLKRDYQQNPRPMGVFLIRNNVSDKVLLGAGLDLHGLINRHKFQLKNGSHPNKSLQADWNELGSNNFAFEIVDELKPPDDPALDGRAELIVLENLWLERLQPFGERGYNEPKLSRAERLRRINQNSKSSGQI
jgi:hypothetical protein